MGTDLGNVLGSGLAKEETWMKSGAVIRTRGKTISQVETVAEAMAMRREQVAASGSSKKVGVTF